MAQPKGQWEKQAENPPHAVLLQMLTGKWVSVMISTVARLAIADHLASGPRPVSELAKLAGVQEDALYRLLRASASVGIFRENDDGSFSQTPLSDPLRSDAVPCIRNMALMLLDEYHTRSWDLMPWSVETGRPAPEKLFGMEMFEWFGQHPEEAVNFNRAMTDLSQGSAQALAASYDFSGFEDIADLGGGHGTLLAAILRRNPGLRGVLFELPYVAAEARKSPILTAYKDRCRIVKGDFFKSVPKASAYMLKHILHDWDDAEATRILKNCRKSIQPGGKLLVSELIIPPGNEPGMAKLLDLEMLVMAGGRERTETEWRKLFAASGFRLERTVSAPGMNGMLEGVPV